MTSRTRVHMPVPSSSQPSSLLDDLSDSLVALDAPSITKTDLARLHKGRLGDALSFTSEHVKGRKEVAIARNHIHKSAASSTLLDFTTNVLFLRLRETSRARSALKAPSGSIELELTRSSTDKAASRLSSAKRAVETYQKQLNERLTLLAESRTFRMLCWLQSLTKFTKNRSWRNWSRSWSRNIEWHFYWTYSRRKKVYASEDSRKSQMCWTRWGMSFVLVISVNDD